MSASKSEWRGPGIPVASRPGSDARRHPRRCLACHRRDRVERVRRGSRYGEAGFSIAEIAIAVVILLTVLVSVATLMGTIFKVGAISRFRQEATEIASSTLDAQVATGAATLLGEVGYQSLPSVTSSGQTYLIEMEVSPYDPSNAGCQSPASDSGAMLKVSIWVTWTDEKSSATWWNSSSSSSTQQLVEETSLVAVPSSVVNPDLGSILVTIQNASGTPLSDLTVTATPSSGSPLTVTTTDGGCALVLEHHRHHKWLAHVDGVVRVDLGLHHRAGDIQPAQPVEPVGVGGHHHVAVLRAHDQPLRRLRPGGHGHAGVLGAGDQRAAPRLPSNISSMPLSFYNTYLSTSPYVSASPVSVFPMPTSPSYSVVSGSCGSDSAPDGGTTDGQPVTVSAGDGVTEHPPRPRHHLRELQRDSRVRGHAVGLGVECHGHGR